MMTNTVTSSRYLITETFSKQIYDGSWIIKFLKYHKNQKKTLLWSHNQQAQNHVLKSNER